MQIERIGVLLLPESHLREPVQLSGNNMWYDRYDRQLYLAKNHRAVPRGFFSFIHPVTQGLRP